MGFKNMKRDDYGHVISNDETDGQECKHASGQADKVEDQKYNKEMKEAQEQNAAMSESFDDDYDEEFDERDEKQYVDKIMDDIAKASDKKAFEYVADNIDELTEAGLISDETADRLYNELDIKIDESNEKMPLFNTKKELSLEDAINITDDDILDEEFGKDTPERKLAGAIKNAPSGGGDRPNDDWKNLTYDEALNSDDDTFLKYFGSEVANHRDQPETLDEYYERMKSQIESDREEWADNINYKFGLGKKVTQRYLDLKNPKNKSQAMKAPINKVSMSALPKHHFDKNGHLVIDEGEYKGIYTNEREFWNDVNASNPNVIYKEWDKMTPEEQKDTKINAKNVFDYLNDKYYNDNIKDKPAKADIDLLKKFLGNEKLTDEEFEKMTGLLERYVK